MLTVESIEYPYLIDSVSIEVKDRIASVIKKGKYKYKDGIIYCDIFEEIAIIANHAYHSLKYTNDLTI